MKLEKIKLALQQMLESFQEVSTDKGIMAFDSDNDLPIQGESVWMVDDKGERFEAENGDYTTADGHVIKVEAGKVTEVQEKELMEAQEQETTPVPDESVEETIQEPEQETVEEPEAQVEMEAQVEETVEEVQETDEWQEKFEEAQARIKELEDKLSELEGKFEKFSREPAVESGASRKLDNIVETADERFERLKEIMRS